MLGLRFSSEAPIKIGMDLKRVGPFALVAVGLLMLLWDCEEGKAPNPQAEVAAEKPSSKKRVLPQTEIDKMVTGELQKTDVLRRIDQLSVESENEKIKRLQSSQGLKRDFFQEGALDMEMEQNKASDWLPSDTKEDPGVRARVYEELARQKLETEMQSLSAQANYERKRAFMLEFQANAMKEGIELILDDNLNVIGTRPLRSPNSVSGGRGGL